MAIKEELILIITGIFFTTTLAIAIVFILSFFKKKTEFLRSIHDMELKNIEIAIERARPIARATAGRFKSQKFIILALINRTVKKVGTHAGLSKAISSKERL